MLMDVDERKRNAERQVLLMRDLNHRFKNSLSVVKSIAGKTLKRGDIVGDNLDKERVAEVYVSDGKENIAVKIVEQAEKKLVVKLPATLKPGRYAFVVMLPEVPPMFIEEPVKVTIE